MATTHELMGVGSPLTLPRLDEVVIEHRANAGDEPSIALARTLLGLDIAVPKDWEAARRDPTAYVGITLARWITQHGGAAIKRRFDLTAAITSWLDSYAERGPPTPNQLYLTVDTGSAGYVVLDAALELLGRAHPKLPATFLHLFSGALSKWIRLYDHQDALEHVAMLREWIEGEPDEAQYEVPDVEGCIPACIKLRPLARKTLLEMVSSVGDETAKSLLAGTMELEEISKQAKRPMVTDEMREEMGDMNPPLPSLLVVFKSNDAIEACFDEEAQNMMECAPEPSLVIGGFRTNQAKSATQPQPGFQCRRRSNQRRRQLNTENHRSSPDRNNVARAFKSSGSPTALELMGWLNRRPLLIIYPAK
jgi:hypothetical protein